MDTRTQTTLGCGMLALAIAISTLLRGRMKLVHLLFALFAADIGLWYVFQSLFFHYATPLGGAGLAGGQGQGQDGIWERINAHVTGTNVTITATTALAVALPQFALHLFDAMIPHEDRRPSRLLHWGHRLGLPMGLVVLATALVHLVDTDLAFRLQSNPVVRNAVFFYVFALLAAGLYALDRRGRQSSSRATQRRVRVLVIIGALAGLATLVDFAWFVGAAPPSVGAVLSVVFLFALAEALSQERLLELYEMLARLLVTIAVAFLIAFIVYVCGSVLFPIGSLLAALVLVLVYEPLRARVEEQIQKRFFRERFQLEVSLAQVRQRLVHILEVDEMGGIVTAALENSRRVTDAALYLRDQDGTGFDRLAALGARAPERIEVATARALLDRLSAGPLLLDVIEQQAREQRGRGERPDAGEAVLAAAAVLGALRTSAMVGIRDQAGELIGLLVVADDRPRGAFSPEEAALVESIAAPIGVVIENSRVYAQLKERDRLAVLGQMAAGLAHEIRNPLGAIKGAAQLLSNPGPGARDPDPSAGEFLGIILEEVDRLDRVVGSVLDLARQSQGTVVPIDVNAVVRRTIQVLSAEPASDHLKIEVTLDASLPRVAIDPEQLRQVLMNLFGNAGQAMKGRGRVTISTRVRFGRGTRSGAGANDPFVELTVADNGPGISQKVLDKLFVPFFTTKAKGTGLGLAISQRIVRSAGGRIDVRSYEGKGSTFAVILPAAMDALGTPTPRAVAVAEDAAASDAPDSKDAPDSRGGASAARLDEQVKTPG